MAYCIRIRAVASEHKAISNIQHSGLSSGCSFFHFDKINDNGINTDPDEKWAIISSGDMCQNSLKTVKISN
jgi:hypothetical protein